MFLFNFLILILINLTLTSCSTWTADKCSNTNWESQGYSHGLAGKNSSIRRYINSCQKKGISIDSSSYDVGYKRGLSSYCNYNKGHQTAFTGLAMESICSGLDEYRKGYGKGTEEHCTSENGFKIGIDGGNPSKVCSEKNFATFMSGFKKGRKKFIAEEIENIKEDLVKAKKDLDNVRDMLADKQYQLNRIPKHTYEHDVIRLREELEFEVTNLMKDRDDIKKAITQMTDNLNSFEKELR